MYVNCLCNLLYIERTHCKVLNGDLEMNGFYPLANLLAIGSSQDSIESSLAKIVLAITIGYVNWPFSGIAPRSRQRRESSVLLLNSGDRHSNLLAHKLSVVGNYFILNLQIKISFKFSKHFTLCCGQADQNGNNFSLVESKVVK